jgi:uncharacterized protein (DUF1778 family)
MAATKRIGISLRMQPEEKAAFDKSAHLAGINLSAWIISRLREDATEELAKHGEIPAFLKSSKKTRLQ